MDYVIAIAAIVGVVSGIKMAFEPDKKPFIFFLAACVAGLVFGFLHWFGLPTLEAGFAAALASSGAYQVAKRVGGN